MNIFKRKNSIYYLKYTDHTGAEKRISTGERTKSAALKFLSTFKIELKEREAARQKSITLINFISEYITYSENTHRPKTTKQVKTIFAHFAETAGDISLTEITPAMIIKHLHNKKQSASVHTAQKHLAYLRSGFNYAVNQSYIESNPCDRIKNFKTPEKQARYLSREQFKLLIAHTADNDLRDLFQIAVLTGLRQMELITLTWRQIDLAEKIINLDNRNGNITKNGKARTIPLNDSAAVIIAERQTKATNEYVFTYNKKPINQDFISHKFKKIVRAAGMPEYKFHDLRSTFASWALQAGGNLHFVSKCLGHSETAVTEKHYGFIRTEDLRRTAELISF
jgi:integrase